MQYVNIKEFLNRIFYLLDGYYEIIYSIYPEIFDIKRNTAELIENNDINILIDEYKFVSQYYYKLQNLLMKLKSDSRVNLSINEKNEMVRCCSVLNSFLNKLVNGVDSDIKNNDFAIKQLLNEIKELRESNKKLNMEKIADSEKNIDLIKEKDKEIENNQERIKILNKELQDIKSDIINDWNINIENAFKALNDGAKSINDEYKRVKYIHSFYFLGLLFSCILLFFLMKFVITSLYLHSEPVKYVEFIPYYLPLGFCGTIIWLCVSQMNKAQRQLIALSDKIYRIKYLEGSLKGLNHVEQDKKVLSQKTIHVLDKIIDKHLNESFKSMDENTIIKEEKKDNNEDINVIRIMVNALNKAIEK